MLLFALLLPLLQGPPEVPEDVVTSTKGREYKGVILYQDSEVLVLGQGTKAKEFKRSKIEKTSGPRVDYGQYISKLEYTYVKKASATDAVKLAQWCANRGLKRDVEMHYWQALVKDPGNVVAREALGHRLSGEEWRAPTGSGQWLSLEDLDAWHTEQNQPWVFYTAHFKLIANGKLEETLRAAAHLELLYARYYDVLQEMAGFYELLQPLTVRIYASRDAGYPEVSPGILGYFDQQTELVNTWFDDGKGVNLVRVVCHALQFRCVTERSRARPLDYPGWLNEGVATHFDSSFTKNDGFPEFYFERINLDWFRVHYKADPKLDIDEVLNLPITGFQNSKKSDCAHAQSYTLIYYLLHADDHEINDGFNEYLHGVFAGKGGSSAFKKAFNRSTFKGLEKNWTDFVEKSVLRGDK